ncbi:hypothetical protein RhiJN_19968 [Ceratobasidium sp. AG-Ba]|nr:hypothetical protein RhiJN_19968 [Ceratobasidium sp. AG-Ba]
MRGPPKKWLQGETVKRKPNKKEVRVYDVVPSTSGRSVTYNETDNSKKRRATAHLDRDDELILNREVQEQWEDDLPDAYNQEPIPDLLEVPDNDMVELEHMLDDVNEAFQPSQPHGKGQNAMLETWLHEWADFYLDEFYEHHGPPLGSCPWCKNDRIPVYSCDDCLSLPRFCNHCLLTRHATNPTHRISCWNGSAWSRVSLKNCGLTIVLGEHVSPCNQAVLRDFTLGDLTGLHDVRVAFCGCPNAPEQNLQLLKVHILPCSESVPSSGFTFACMRQFHFASTEAKMSVSRYHSILQRSTNNMLPHYTVDRFREFLRCTRMWTRLQDLKRSSAGNSQAAEAQELALRCPACPTQGFNHENEDIEPGLDQQISYDGSFQLVRKNKAYDKHDVCLSDGAMYWVPMQEYKDHLAAKKDDAYEQSTRGGECNNHRAANDTWVRRTGVAESGVGAVTCARHTFYMPQGMVPYFKGERFVYTDFAIASVLSLLLSEKASSFIIFYDIYCHWVKGFWQRLAAMMFPNIPDDIQEMVRGGVGKYHIAGHTDLCYARYSPNHMFGVGRVDAEGCERAWADLNLAARSSSEKGPGARIDSLNSCMQDWNWRKTINIVTFCLTKYKEAVRMARETAEEWHFFHSLLPHEVTAEWATWSTEPYQEPGSKIWKSVFISNEGASTSVTRTLMELNRLERQDDQTSRSEPGAEADKLEIPPALTAPAWISEGLEIELQQRRLIVDLESYGNQITDRQSLECFNRRSALSSRISRHRQSAAFFVDVMAGGSDDSGSLAEETDGQPERAVLYLPSRLGPKLMDAERSQKAKDYEYTLRRVTCLRALHRVKNHSIQKRNMLRGKAKHARGQTNTTRVQGMIDRMSRRVDMAAWEYGNCRGALRALGLKEHDKRTLRELKDRHVSELSKFLDLDRNLGQGYKTIPWIWQLTTAEPDAHIESVETAPNTPKGLVDIEKEVDDANRVEWFRGRERYKRWEEEALWLRREIASVILDFDRRAQVWNARASSDAGKRSMGYRAYSIRQRDAWTSLRQDALDRAKHMLTARPSMAICDRVISLFDVQSGEL